MLDKKRVRLMARLAIYDKRYGAVDRRKNNYFKWDYIYFKNFWTRLGVFFGCMIIALFYALYKLIVEQADVFELDIRAEAVRIGFYTLMALALYTIIGTLVAKTEYKKSRARLDAYFSMLAMLDKMNESDERPDEQYEEDEREEPLYGVRGRNTLQEPPEPMGEPRRTFSRNNDEGKKSLDMLMRLKGVDDDEGSAGDADVRKGGIDNGV